MSTNIDYLVELDPDHNILENGTLKGVVIMIHRWNLTKHSALKIIYIICT